MSDGRHPYDVAVGQRVRELRLRFRVKQRELAERLGLDEATVSRYEQGTRGMNVSTLLTIADLFQVAGATLLPPVHHAAPAITASQPASPEQRALASLTQVLQERPELIPVVMTVIERMEEA